MENRRAIIISLICFIISMMLIMAYVNVRRHELTAEFGEEVPVVVAAETIPDYQVIRPGMLKIVTVFKNYRQPQTVTDISDIVGKSAFATIYKDEQVTLTKLITQDGRPVLDRQIEKKMRAITLPVTPFMCVSRLIRPGNRVDVLTSVNYDTPDGGLMYEIKTVLQNVLVLATGKQISNAVPTRVNREVLQFLEEQFEARKRRDFTSASMEGLPVTRADDNYSNITVQLSPEDAEKLQYLTSKFGDGRIYLALRNSADVNADNLDTTILDDVLGPESDYGASKRKPPPLPPPKPPRFFDSRGSDVIPVE